MVLTGGAIRAPLISSVASLNVPPPSHILGGPFFDFPDTPLAKRAETFVKDFLPSWAANHSFRTYAFALAIASHAGWDKNDRARDLGFDKELIFLACALHEIGFHPEAQKSPLSLELWGAIKAREWILGQAAHHVAEKEESPLPDGRASQSCIHYWADEVCEAIARHTLEFRNVNSRVRLTGALLTLGAGQDLMGLSTQFIHPDDIRIICARWPRLGYCDGLKSVSAMELQNKPGCLFEDCTKAFDPGMYEVACFQGLQGDLRQD